MIRNCTLTIVTHNGLMNSSKLTHLCEFDQMPSRIRHMQQAVHQHHSRKNIHHKRPWRTAITKNMLKHKMKQNQCCEQIVYLWNEYVLMHCSQRVKWPWIADSVNKFTNGCKALVQHRMKSGRTIVDHRTLIALKNFELFWLGLFWLALHFRRECNSCTVELPGCS